MKSKKGAIVFTRTKREEQLKNLRKIIDKMPSIQYKNKEELLIEEELKNNQDNFLKRLKRRIIWQ